MKKAPAKPANRAGTGRFQKGQSGNPSGRPKINDEVQALAREHTKDAISRLAFWMQSDNAKASVSASAALLDRGWGKPAQTVHLPDLPDVPLYALPAGAMPSVTKERGTT